MHRIVWNSTKKVYSDFFFIRFQSQCMRIPDVCDVLSPLVQSSTRTEFLFHMLLYQNNLLLCLKMPWMILILQLRSTWEISHPLNDIAIGFPQENPCFPFLRSWSPASLDCLYIGSSYPSATTSGIHHSSFIQCYWSSTGIPLFSFSIHILELIWRFSLIIRLRSHLKISF